MNEDARPRSNQSRGRAFFVFGAAAAAVLAVGLAVSAFTSLRPASGVVLEAETVSLAEPPATVAPLAQLASEDDDAIEPPTTTTAAEPAPETTTSAPTPARAPRIPPTGIEIDSLGLEGHVRPVGLEADGAMEVPPVTEVGWYEYGATPGAPGATVLVAHVWWGDRPGPFHKLGAVEPGATIAVEIADGESRSYQIVERTMYDKDSLPADLWRKTGPETLVLITCGGDFDTSSRRYEQNIVVYAVPMDAPTSAPS